MRIEPTSPVNRAARVQLGQPATMRDPGRAPLDVVVRDLSETGALLDAEGALPVGTLVSLGIAGAGLRLARVTREAPGGMAIEFMLPLDPRMVAVAGRVETLVSVAFPQMIVEPPAARLPDARVLPVPAEATSQPAVAGVVSPAVLAAALVAVALLIYLVG